MSQKKSTQWLREATMKRLNMLVRNKFESTTFSNQIALADISCSDLQNEEIILIEKWFHGHLSGRNCLLGLLEYNKYIESEERNSIKSFNIGAMRRPVEFEMLSSSLFLPEEFLCDSGYLYETVFCKPPSVVLKEALQLITLKAMESSFSLLNVKQINLALKQLRIEYLSQIPSDDSRLHAYRLSIMIELIRQNIKLSNQISCVNHESDMSISRHKNGKRRSTETKFNCSNKPAARQPHVNKEVIDIHLNCDVQLAIEQAKMLSIDDLEYLNQVFKPYVRQLSSLKTQLTIQLKEFEEKKAYIALGISKDASAAAIKKAYHSKAIQLHPDKPGGDTVKFQELQTSYQEILSKRKSDEMNDNLTLDPKTQQESVSASKILEELAIKLDAIKFVADECTALGHLNIRFQKQLDKHASKDFPIAIISLLKLFVKRVSSSNLSKNRIKVDTGGDFEIPDFDSSYSDNSAISHASAEQENIRNNFTKIDFKSCAPSHAVPLIETLVENVQQLTSVAMQIPSCGFRHGLATAMNAEFMTSVEQTMTIGLGAMKLVGALITADEQINISIEKLKIVGLEGQKNEDIHDILVDMITTSFHSGTSTIQHAADKCVDAALSASQLYGIAKSIAAAAKEEAEADFRRMASKLEKETDLCEEDKILMADRNKKLQEASELRHVTEKEETKTDDDDAANISVDGLRDKIKNLQIQLRAQHIQAIQSMNSETRQLQRQLQTQLYEMVTETIMLDKGRTTNIGSTTSVEVNLQTSNLSNFTAANTFNTPPLRESLLSLLADFVDSSCNTLRDEIQSQESITQTIEISVPGDISQNSSSKLQKILSQHLGWMTALAPTDDFPTSHELLRNESNVMMTATAVEPVNESSSISTQSSSKSTIFTKQPSMIDIDESIPVEINDTCQEGSDKENHTLNSRNTTFPCATACRGVQDVNNIQEYVEKPRLALLPDIRSKVLWLSSLVDSRAVEELVSIELSCRLRECVKIFDEEPSSPVHTPTKHLDSTGACDLNTPCFHETSKPLSVECAITVLINKILRGVNAVLCDLRMPK